MICRCSRRDRWWRRRRSETSRRASGDRRPRLEIAAGDPGAAHHAGRRTPCRPTAARCRRVSTIFMSTPKIGAALLALDREPASLVRRALDASHLSCDTVPSGLISVMPQAWMHLDAVVVLEGARSSPAGRPSRRSPCASSVEKRALGLRHVLQQAEPDGRHAGAERHLLALEQLVQALAVELRAGEHQLRARPAARRRECPRH